MTIRARHTLGILLALIAFSAPSLAVECTSDAFIASSEYEVTSFYPYRLVTADFNGDGLIDIATFGGPYYYVGNISLLLGNPDGSFQTAQTVGTADHGYDMTAGLFDAGDAVDLVLSLDDGNVAFFAGNGDGTFQPAVVSSFPDESPTLTALASGDFNDDGDLDLAGTNGSSNVSIILGNGDGTFGDPAWFPAGVPTGTLAVGDVDDNGTLDVAAGGNGTSVAILLGDGSGNLGPAQDFAAGSQVWDVHLADLDGNGDLDLVLTCGTYAGVLLGNGDGTFQAARKFPGGPDPRVVGIADFDGDGIPDLAVGSSNSDAVKILLGLGNGNFVQGALYSVGQHIAALVIADFGDDGLADVAVSGGNQSIVSVLYGNGDGTLRGVRTEAQGAYIRSLAQGDFNGDGLPDLAATGDNSLVRILLGTPEGGFLVGQSLPTPNANNSPVAVGDFDGDEILDLIAASYDYPVLFPGMGDGEFGQAVTLAGPAYSTRAILAADYDDDGKLDYALLFDGGNISVALGNGNGTFQSYLTSSGPPTTSSALVADLDGDEIPDIATSNGVECCYGISTVSVSIGRGDGTFEPPVAYTTGATPTGVAAGHFNGDGVLDLVTANRDNTISLLFGNGDGTFQGQQLVGVGPRPFTVVAQDFDGDGLTDVLTANVESASATFLRGLGEGAFESPVTYRVGSKPGALLVVDLFGNGIPDAVTGNAEGLGGVSLLVNTRLGVGTLPVAGACDGSVAVLRAHAAGLGPLTYQWRKDGVDVTDGGHISGATTATLTFDPASPADDGIYDVVVSDACGTVTSNGASFTVTTAPVQPVIAVDVPPAPGVAGVVSIPVLPFHTYTWVIGGDAAAVITSGQGTPQITFLAQIPGTVTLQVTEFSSPGCGTASAVLALPVDFYDVPASHPFHADIVTIARDEITAGCGGGNYCPSVPVTRAQMAVFLLKSLHGADWIPPFVGNYFNDVPPGSFAAEWINNLASLGVTSGCGGGDYCPGSSVTRAQMAPFILKTLGIFYPPPATFIFEDVPPGSFAADFIDDIYNRGITGGCSVDPKLYCPNGLVTRGQMAVFLVRAFLEPAP